MKCSIKALAIWKSSIYVLSEICPQWSKRLVPIAFFKNQGMGLINVSRIFKAFSYPNSTYIEHNRRQKKRKGQNTIWKKEEEKKLLVPEKHLNNSIHNKNQIPSGLD